MKIIDYLKTTQNNLFRQKLRTSLTMIAIFIGAFTLSLTNGIGEGVTNYLEEQLSASQSDYKVLIVTAKNKINFGGGATPVGDIPEYVENKQILEGVSFIPMTENDCNLLKSNEQINPNLNLQDIIKSVYCFQPIETLYITNPKETKKYIGRVSGYVPEIKYELIAGDLINSNTPNQIMLTKRYAEVLGFENPQTAVSQTINIGVKNINNEIKEFPATIVGIQPNSFINGGQPIGSSQLIDEMYAYSINNDERLLNQYFGAFIALKKDTTQEQLETLKNYLQTKEFNSETIEELLGRVIISFIDLVKWGLNIFALIVLLVASFGIANTILMNVYERTREIGLMRALGSSRRGIFLLMSMEAMILGFWGATLGLLFAIITGNLLSILASNTILKDIDGFNLFAFPVIPSILTILLIIVLAFIASIIPSIKASNIDPIKALRQE